VILFCYIAACCSVLQCVAVCCSVLQCVAVCCSVLQALQDILENCVIRLYCMILDSIIMFIIMSYVHYHVIHPWLWRRKMQALRCRRTATTHCNVSAATHCNTPGAGICQHATFLQQHTATHCNVSGICEEYVSIALRALHVYVNQLYDLILFV